MVLDDVKWEREPLFIGNRLAQKGISNKCILLLSNRLTCFYNWLEAWNTIDCKFKIGKKRYLAIAYYEDVVPIALWLNFELIQSIRKNIQSIEEVKISPIAILTAPNSSSTTSRYFKGIFLW